jgi:hypothetical protein
VPEHRLSPQAILAVGRIVARSDDVVRRWRLRGHAVVPTRPWLPVSLRLASIIRRSQRPRATHFYQTPDEPDRATGNVPMASRTQPHTPLKYLRVRGPFLPWNAALLCPLCGCGRIRD